MSCNNSRFFTNTDPVLTEMIYQLPDSWWSRPYEYEWVKNFCSPNDVVLDAASGVLHPLRFWLAHNCKEVFSCDLDKNIKLPLESINPEDSMYGIGIEKFEKLFPQPQNLHSDYSSITKLPYKDNFFDKIFCVSVLEHLKDFFNSHPKFIHVFPLVNSFLPKTIYVALKEFRRVLKDDGQLIVTFDYPDISLTYLFYLVEKLGYSFVGNVDEHIYDNTLTEYRSNRYYHCFRAILKKV